MRRTGRWRHLARPCAPLLELNEPQKRPWPVAQGSSPQQEVCARSEPRLGPLQEHAYPQQGRPARRHREARQLFQASPYWPPFRLPTLCANDGNASTACFTAPTKRSNQHSAKTNLSGFLTGQGRRKTELKMLFTRTAAAHAGTQCAVPANAHARIRYREVGSRRRRAGSPRSFRQTPQCRRRVG
jgi:hypothetical protein